MDTEILCEEKDDVITKKAKHRHELKGSIRNLRFILDELEHDDVINNEATRNKCFNDFNTNLEKIKKVWKDYQLFLTIKNN
ncbi:MAG: hypothetical protein HQK51_14525 [Oligoflexia bacterium]|nr:hypothetical protein [Oligoflexia bacterium]